MRRCMYVEFQVSKYVCMYVRTYVCMNKDNTDGTQFFYECSYAFIYVCMNVCMYVCMQVERGSGEVENLLYELCIHTSGAKQPQQRVRSYKSSCTRCSSHSRLYLYVCMYVFYVTEF